MTWMVVQVMGSEYTWRGPREAAAELLTAVGFGEDEAWALLPGGAVRWMHGERGGVAGQM